MHGTSEWEKRGGRGRARPSRRIEGLSHSTHAYLPAGQLYDSPGSNTYVHEKLGFHCFISLFLCLIGSSDVELEITERVVHRKLRRPCLAGRSAPYHPVPLTQEPYIRLLLQNQTHPTIILFILSLYLTTSSSSSSINDLLTIELTYLYLNE